MPRAMAMGTPAIRIDPLAAEGVAAAPVSLASLPLLRLLQLASPALPTGAFAYSQGLEQAIALAWVTDEASAQAWILGLLSSSFGRLDLPVLARLYAAFARDDLAGVRAWTDLLLAGRASAELQAEDRQMGGALARVLAGLSVDGARDWMTGEPATAATLFALAAVRWEIPLRPAALGFAFSWIEAQVGAATRLCPLGQQAAQRIVSHALPVIDEVVVHALALRDQEIGAASVAQAMASALHETLYSRLCRS